MNPSVGSILYSIVAELLFDSRLKGLISNVNNLLRCETPGREHLNDLLIALDRSVSKWMCLQTTVISKQTGGNPIPKDVVYTLSFVFNRVSNVMADRSGRVSCTQKVKSLESENLSDRIIAGCCYIWSFLDGPAEKTNSIRWQWRQRRRKPTLYLYLCSLARRGPEGLDLYGEGISAALGHCPVSSLSNNLAVIVKLFLQTLKKHSLCPWPIFQ